VVQFVLDFRWTDEVVVVGSVQSVLQGSAVGALRRTHAVVDAFVIRGFDERLRDADVVDCAGVLHLAPSVSGVSSVATSVVGVAQDQVLRSEDGSLETAVGDAGTVSESVGGSESPAGAAVELRADRGDAFLLLFTPVEPRGQGVLVDSSAAAVNHDIVDDVIEQTQVGSGEFIDGLAFELVVESDAELTFRVSHSFKKAIVKQGACCPEH